MNSWVLHIDMDAFFASVSLLDKTELQNQPVVVAGDQSRRCGVVLAKNQIAKELGIRTAMSLAEALRLVPGLQVLPPEFERYQAMSRAARKIYAKFSERVESFGLDECWLEIASDKASETAEEIRSLIRKNLGLSVSIGIADNKVFAKLASDMAKPGGIVWLSTENWRERVWPLPVETLLFVGQASAKRLHELGIRTIAELAACPAEVLSSALGKNGLWLHTAANGQNRERVRPSDEQAERKSISIMETLAHDLSSPEQAHPLLEAHLQELCRELKNRGLRARCLQLWYKTITFRSFTRQLSLSHSADQAEAFLPLLQRLLFEQADWSLPLRALGLGFSQLESSDTPRQMQLSELAELAELAELTHSESASPVVETAAAQAVFEESFNPNHSPEVKNLIPERSPEPPTGINPPPLEQLLFRLNRELGGEFLHKGLSEKRDTPVNKP